MYQPMQNQWRQNQSQQSNVQSAQPETSVANNNPQNSQAKQENNSPSVSAINNNAIIQNRGRILTITGGNSLEHENNSQRTNYFRRVNSISMKGPYKKTRWSHMPIIFSEEDLQLKDYPHMDAMVIKANVDGWAVSKILVDEGSSVDIIFTSTIDAIKIDRKMLGRAEHPLYGFDEKKIHSIGRIILLVSFGTVSNARTEQIEFDVVDMYYLYIAVISYSYLCMKMLAINGVITVHGDQTEARNIKKNTL